MGKRKHNIFSVLKSSEGNFRGCVLFDHVQTRWLACGLIDVHRLVDVTPILSQCIFDGWLSELDGKLKLSSYASAVAQDPIVKRTVSFLW